MMKQMQRKKKKLTVIIIKINHKNFLQQGLLNKKNKNKI